MNDEEDKAGHSRAEPCGLGASPECPSRIHPWTVERIMTAFWDVSNAVGRMDAQNGSRVPDSRLVTPEASLVVGSLRTLLVQLPKLLEACQRGGEAETPIHPASPQEGEVKAPQPDPVGEAKAPFRTGDVVYEKATGANLAVAWADPATGYLSWFGWPPGESKISGYEMLRPASDEEHRDSLLALKRSGGKIYERACRLYGDPDALATLHASQDQAGEVRS